MARSTRRPVFARPDNRRRRREIGLEQFALDTARRDFDTDSGAIRFGPVVALVAAYDEEGNIGDVLKAMPDEAGGLEVTTLVVVDGGTDRTADIAREAGVATCVLPVNMGQGTALKLGYELASEHGARYVVTLDADGQYDPGELEDILEPVLTGEADMVIASRRLGVDQTSDRLRRAGVKVYAWAINRIIGQRLSDSSNGYRAFRIEVLDDVVPFLVQDQYQTSEVIITAATRGWRLAQRPTVWHPRAAGASKKGGNLFFGLQYGRVIATTWWRSRRFRVRRP
ncbi:MAG: glycosyltransferase family 2 protein [Acidimicrobiales bacterium]|nr:glycosyltransferase family 2 protein [Acidimicrobiales bacterium]